MDIQEERKAIFVGIIKQEDDESKVMEYLDELEFLAETAGLTGDRQFIQRVDKPEKATYIRSGKLEEIAQYCEENEIKYVIFDDELTGMQQRNIEKIVKTSIVIDRTSLTLKYSRREPRRLTPRCRSNWRDTITCSRASPACGRILNAKEAVSECVEEWERHR